MGDNETIDLDSVGLLDADTIPNANQSLNCFSCGEDMNGVFCYACGNKNDNFRRSIWALGIELFSSLTAFEGKIWRSLRSLLFKPGKMAREFADGARQKWTSPIRMYLATSLLLFGYIALSQTQLIAFGTKMNTSSIIQTGGDNWNFSPQIFFLERTSTIQKTVSENAISAFEKDMINIINSDKNKSKEELERELEITRKSRQQLETQIENSESEYVKAGLGNALLPIMKRIETLETLLENLNTKPKIANDSAPSEDETAQTEMPPDGYGLNGERNETSAGEETNINFSGIDGQKFSLDAAGVRQAISIGLRHPERVNAPIGKWLPRIMFLMMPFSMLLGAIFIRGREKAMLFDHLVHAAYIHAFSFLLLFVFILLVQFTPIKGLLIIYTLILLIYLPISAKRMFGRGWFKTFLTSYGVGIIYTFNMMIILSILIGLGLSDIISDVAVQTPA